MLPDMSLFIILIIVLANVMFNAFNRVGYQFLMIDRVVISLTGVAVFLISAGIVYAINAIF